nr:hypothetical protein [candidate division Zixibacteria bacterium]
MADTEKIVALKKRIKNILLKERLILFLAGILGTFSGLLAVWIVLSLLAGIVILPVWTKIGLLSVAGLSTFYAFWRLAFSRFFHGTPESVAIRLEQKFPGLKGRLIAALQFSASPETEKIGYSPDLIEATLIQAAETANGLNFNEIVSPHTLWRNLKTLGISTALALLLLFVFPGLFSYSYQVYSNPTETVAPPLGYQLKAYPGSGLAVKYRDVDLGGVLLGDKFPEAATVYYKFAGGIWQKTEIELTNRPRISGSLGDSLMFFTTLKQVRRSVDYYVKAGRETTTVEHIDVVDRPRVTGIKMSMFYPQYTGLQPTVIDENEGSISAVYGTRVNMQIETNLPVVRAEMVFADSSRAPFTISGQTAEQSFRIEQDWSYYIYLVDVQNEVNPDPIEYHITSIPDEYPVIDVIRPGIDVNLNEEMIVPLLVRISDDYGFSSLVLKYSIVSEGRKSDENVAVLHFNDRIKTEGEINFNWNVEPLNLMPSDYIQYHFELADNDRISGPKITSSRVYIARLPSLEEIIAQTDEEYNQNIDRSEQFLKASKDLAERLKNIARKLDQDKGQTDQKLPWQHKKELEEIARKNAEISEEMDKTAQKIDEMVNRLQENRLASRELLEKLAEIQKLFEEVATPEMKEARLKLLEALKQMDPQKLDEAMKDFQLSQEEMMQRLERTIALLKKMKVEQKVEAMTEMARELVEKQTRVNEQTADAKSEQLPSLTPAEQKVKQGLEGLKKEAANLRQMLGATQYQKANEADQFCKAVENSTAGENMENMMNNLDGMKKEKSLQEGDQARSKLLSMLDKLQQGQRSMCRGGGQEVARKMREAIDDINYLSNEEEGLIGDAASFQGESEVLRDLAAQQQIVKESVGGLERRIEALGKESPFIAAQLQSLIQKSMGNLDLAIDQLSDRHGSQAIQYQREALYNLNRAAVQMLDALESQKNCDKGGNCDKPSQKLSSLCDKQMELNRQTQSQCPNPSQMNPGGEEAMRRLAGEQGTIQKSLRELQDEFGNSREVLGRLDAIADDMQKVIDELSSGEVGQNTLDRQLKIYSRMLDASRTMQRKDFTEQRKASVGEDVLRNSPPALSGDQLQGGLDIEDRLRRFLNESYPPEYEQHIKAYFKALLEQIENKGNPEQNEN